MRMENDHSSKKEEGGEKEGVVVKAQAPSSEKTYRLRQSLFVLAFRLMTLELIFGLVITLSYLVFRIMSPERSFWTTGGFWILIALNLFFLFLVILMWSSHYYVISPHEVLKSRGIVFRFTMARDLASVRSVRVKQNLFQRLCNYGTLELEADLMLGKDFVLHNVRHPYQHARCIDALRMNQSEEEGGNGTWDT